MRHVLKLDAEIFGDQLAAGEDRNVLQHGLPAVTETGGFHGRNLEAAAQLVHDQRGNRFTFDILSDNDEGPTRLHDGFQYGQHRLQAGEFLLVQQDVGILELSQHLLGICDEIGRDVTAIELHAFDDLDLGVEQPWLPRR